MNKTVTDHCLICTWYHNLYMYMGGFIYLRDLKTMCICIIEYANLRNGLTNLYTVYSSI